MATINSSKKKDFFTETPSLPDFLEDDSFEKRHQYLTQEQLGDMLEAIGVSDLESLIDKTIPEHIRLTTPLCLPPKLSEKEALESLPCNNEVAKSYIGMGYYETMMPAVIRRNILENPGWYTAYTPYQSEISQGRLEMLLNFQTLITELTHLPIANASLLDESSAAGEAIALLWSSQKNKKPPVFVVHAQTHPQTLSVLATRAHCMGVEMQIKDFSHSGDIPDCFAVMLQYPTTEGCVQDMSSFSAELKARQIKLAVATDILALCLFSPPGEWGADIAFGTVQRMGMPMGYGGPHAAFFATGEEWKRNIPGRIIGVCTDYQGNKAYRMALQTREQHIRREKATSNICTAQVLPAILSTAFAIYHGPEGLKKIAKRVYHLSKVLQKALHSTSIKTQHRDIFDTVLVKTNIVEQKKIKQLAEKNKINFRYFSNGHIGVSIGQNRNYGDVREIIDLFTHSLNKESVDIEKIISTVDMEIREELRRKSPFLSQKVFHNYHTEHELLRYLKRLENKDFSLTTGMIPLGSCTMKLNSTTQMLPIVWSQIAEIHPFAPSSQTKGYKELIQFLGDYLCEITGFSAISFQPNSGAQGEFAGLLAIKRYHIHRGDNHRKVVLIPISAHGTNPASAKMAGLEVVNVGMTQKGTIDYQDLKEKAEKYKETLSALMVTYPSTYGIFEEDIQQTCDIIHKNGGMVYMDGANMNAQLGLTNPKIIGADVCHLNLHKTFCIPHGGGGPGMGPIAVNKKLAPFLPGHIQETNSMDCYAVASTPYGSASILTISYLFIRMMGGEGLKNASKYAILKANYIKSQLEKEYAITYKNKNQCVAHELIIDCKEFKHLDITAEDIAKRLMDYGFHAPTVAFPIINTLMIEPTESETKQELDRFCLALQMIRKEIEKIEKGEWTKTQNPLKNAPHTAAIIAGDWQYPYSREEAVYPLEEIRENKKWPTVSRLQAAKGDRNLICTCT